jgi:hypothetical protein
MITLNAAEAATPLPAELRQELETVNIGENRIVRDEGNAQPERGRGIHRSAS